MWFFEILNALATCDLFPCTAVEMSEVLSRGKQKKQVVVGTVMASVALVGALTGVMIGLAICLRRIWMRKRRIGLVPDV